MPDFEDAVQAETAKFNEIDAIITRNYSDCEHSGLQVYMPGTFIQKHTGRYVLFSPSRIKYFSRQFYQFIFHKPFCQRKIDMISAISPEWKDLYDELRGWMHEIASLRAQ